MSNKSLSIVESITQGSIGDVAATAGRTTSISLAADLVLSVVGDSLDEALEDWLLTEAVEVTSVPIDQIPESVKRAHLESGSDTPIHEWMYQELKDWANRFKGSVENGYDEAFNAELKLTFGHKHYNRHGKITEPSAYPSRGISNQIVHLLSPKATVESLSNVDYARYVRPPLSISDDFDYYFQTGLNLVAAQSRVGKSTFLENVIKAILRDNKEHGYGNNVGYISWGEREAWSMNGQPNDLVRHIEDSMTERGIVFVDSARLYTIAGPGDAAGQGGLHTNFFVNLTQWHQAAIDHNVCLVLLINPVVNQQDIIANLKEILRGAVDSVLHMVKRGAGKYEHAITGSQEKDVKIPIDFGGELEDDHLSGIGSSSEPKEVSSKNIDFKPSDKMQKYSKF